MIITKTSDVLKGTDVLEGTINWAGVGGGGASGSYLGPSYMVSGTRDNPSPEVTLSSVYM